LLRKYLTIKGAEKRVIDILKGASILCNAYAIKNVEAFSVNFGALLVISRFSFSNRAKISRPLKEKKKTRLTIFNLIRSEIYHDERIMQNK
jgi:hypothetical protein